MKVIFLDIDDVLNLNQTTKQDSRSITNLNRITNETGAKIVLISTQRRYKTIEQMRNVFILQHIVGELYDYTPVLLDNNGIEFDRGVEILKWLETNLVDNYVILDNNISNIQPHIQNGVFKIDKNGLRKTDLVNKIINLLS